MMRASDSLGDRIVLGVDGLLRTLAGQHHTGHASPAAALDSVALSEDDRRHAAGLMRVNHAGEVCAQALYVGQALTARGAAVRAVLEDAAREEEDHLAWCTERLVELDSAPSRLNALWFTASYALGATTGLLGDSVSLGLVAATEDQVCRHLERHLQSLPAEDERSRAILRQMHADESRHGTRALESGGAEFPRPVRALMTLVSGVMTRTSYYI
jgi:3-demethoxyubiquinol 3-hydroxylase